MKKLRILLNGIFKENPVLVLILGTCPTLAVSTMAVNGLGMGLAVVFVLVCSNAAISLLKNVIPEKVRIPCYIVIIAGIVTILQLLIQAFAPSIDKALGIYLPLIVVNCIILGRAEMFASRNTVLDSVLDGLGMGLGFTLALVAIGSIREILGSGTWFAGLEIAGVEIGGRVLPHALETMPIFLLAPGGFFVYGCVIALLNYITKGKALKRKTSSCAGCPSVATCSLNKAN